MASFEIMEEIDYDNLDKNPNVKEFVEKSQMLLTKTLFKAIRIIQQIDPSEEFCERQFQVISEDLKSKFDLVMWSVSCLHEHHKIKVDSYLNQISFLEEKLQIKPCLTEDIFATNLLEVEKNLRSIIEKYQLMEKGSRQSDELKEEQAMVHKEEKSSKPSSSSYDKKKNESEHQERFNRIKNKINDICKETGLIPPDKFKEFCDESVDVSEEVLTKMDLFYQKIIGFRAELYENVDALYTKVENLWNLLEVPTIEKQNFIDNFLGYTKESQEKLKIQYERLKQLRQDKLPAIIEQQKVDIKQIWDLCHCSPHVKNEFPCIYSIDYCEELYQKCKEELERWGQYYEQHYDFFNQLERYKNLQERLLEMDLNMAEQNFYKNRKALILSTLTERNKTESRLKATKKKLLALSQSYVQNNNEIFLLGGKTVEKYLAHETQNFQNRKKYSGAYKTTSSISTKHHPGKGTSLPRFKINETLKSGNSPAKKPWKPSKLRCTTTETTEEDSDWADYSDFQSEIANRRSHRSTSLHNLHLEDGH